jgi:hypothetical protein
MNGTAIAFFSSASIQRSACLCNCDCWWQAVLAHFHFRVTTCWIMNFLSSTFAECVGSSVTVNYIFSTASDILPVCAIYWVNWKMACRLKCKMDLASCRSRSYPTISTPIDYRYPQADHALDDFRRKRRQITPSIAKWLHSADRTMSMSFQTINTTRKRNYKGASWTLQRFWITLFRSNKRACPTGMNCWRPRFEQRSSGLRFG